MKELSASSVEIDAGVKKSNMNQLPPIRRNYLQMLVNSGLFFVADINGVTTDNFPTENNATAEETEENTVSYLLNQFNLNLIS